MSATRANEAGNRTSAPRVSSTAAESHASSKTGSPTAYATWPARATASPAPPPSRMPNPAHTLPSRERMPRHTGTAARADPGARARPTRTCAAAQPSNTQTQTTSATAPTHAGAPALETDRPRSPMHQPVATTRAMPAQHR